MDDRPRHTLKIMETETTFDLNLAVRRWREDLAGSSAFRCENLNELESHLRDSIDRLRARDLSGEEAFLIATRRIGNVQRLQQEFGKVNTASAWFDRFLWVVMAIPLWGVISSTAFLLWFLLIAVCQRSNEFLPGFGLQKIGEDWFQPPYYVLGLIPIPIAIAVALLSRYLFLPQRRGSLLMGKLLHRPLALALTMFVLCAVIEISERWLMQNWYYPIVLHIDTSRGLFVQFLPFQLAIIGFWAVLTFFAARKRLRSTVA